MHTSRIHRTVSLALASLVLSLLATACLADPDRIPGQARVALARRERIFFDPNPISTYMYPEGKLDFRVIEPMLDEAVASLTGVADPIASWGAMVKPVDVVGIIVDVGDLPVHLTVVDAVVQKLLKAGVERDNIVIFSGEENELFNAGFEIRRTGPGIRCLGSEHEGYRSGITRIVQDTCTALIEISRLRVDRQLGVSGALADHLACVPTAERVRILNGAPDEIGTVANRPLVRRKMLLHIMDALQPAYDFRVGRALPPRWDYRGLLVSHDPVALDALGAQLLAKYRESVKKEPWPLLPDPAYICHACTGNALGQSDLSKITIIKSGWETDALL